MPLYITRATRWTTDALSKIMVRLDASEEEIRKPTCMIRAAAEEVETKTRQSCQYRIGTIIELPRAAACAASIARHIKFISFGTSDLTQMIYCFSRDDAPRYLDTYMKLGLKENDPFVTINEAGVGAVVASVVEHVRGIGPPIKIGVRGEHGGDPKSIRFFLRLGMGYVTCSPTRIPVARHTVAQAA